MTELPAEGSSSAVESPPKYTLRISRLTIDKLGVKLYDKASAVVAELIANSYDADATDVWVELPLGTELASKDPDTGETVDKKFKIEVRDNGHGMVPDEARAFFLQVGRDRREHPEQGAKSRDKRRPVMGRKGIGKLAPFGICRRIEVISSGGNEVPGEGYLTTHFFLDFDKIIEDADTPVPLEVGDLDQTYRSSPGTTIRLTQFLPKRVPDSDTFHRQVATRFAWADPGFTVHLRNTRLDPPVDSKVKKFDVEIENETKITVDDRPVKTEDGEILSATGWIAMAKNSYKNDELAGVRIYARGKIVATTRDFEQPAGFTGEYHVRSYLVGEILAEWLDDDDGDDLIRTDRQSILWDSERGRAFREWGAALIKEVGKLSAGPRRRKKSDVFMENAKIEERANERYGGDEAVRDAAVKLGEKIGAFAAEDELDDPDYVNDLAEVILAVAPHQALVDAFKQISKRPDASIEELIVLFGKTRLAEMASYGQIAAERVKSINELSAVIGKPDVEEADLQQLIASAPWLIRPDWSVITQNQTLKTFRDRFVAFWKTKYGEDIDVAISYEKKKPDFTLVHHGQMLHVVEIKVPGHKFANEDYDRLANYVEAFDQFFNANSQMVTSFPERYVIDLVADDVNITNRDKRTAFSSFVNEKKVVRQTWNDFLATAARAHEEFLNIYDEAHAEERGSA